MNENKAFLKLEGKPLVERSLAVLQTLFAEVLISSNEPGLYADYEVPIIQDEVLDRGPLEGLYQGLKTAAYDQVFFVACDMPFLDTDLIRLLAKWIPDYDVVIPRLESGPEAGLHPLHAFYHRRCLPAIIKNREAGSLKIRNFFRSCSVKYVGEIELQNFHNLSKALSNINTMEDWVAILRELCD